MARRKDVPLEEFAVDFNPTDFGEEAEIAREKIVTALRFLEKDIRPEFDTFIESNPTFEEIRERPIADEESAKYFLELKEKLPEKINSLSLHVSDYLGYVGKGDTSDKTSAKIHELILAYTNNEFILPLEKMQGALREKLLDFTEFGLDHKEEETETERGVREAGQDNRQPVDRFIRKNK